MKVEMTFENGRKIVYEVYEGYKEAETVLKEAIETGRLNDMPVERIVPEFVFQPWYDETTKDELLNATIKNCPNGSVFKRGSIGLAGDGKDIACPACIFIALGEEKTKRLNGVFMNIGEMIEGFDTLDYIDSLELRKIETEEKVEIYEPVEELRISTVNIIG